MSMFNNPSHPGAGMANPILASQTERHGFSPYTNNGGSILGVAGEEFVVMAGDTRSAEGYSIHSRYAPKLFPIGESATKKPLMVIGLVGYGADGRHLKDTMDEIIRRYESQHNQRMGIHAAAQRLSHVLYSRRFFPLYVHAILAGIDDNGKGALYSYDPIGSYEREMCRSAGAASSLLMPVLDNQVNFKNHHDPATGEPLPAPNLKLDEVLPLVEDVFTSAVERHIEVGDYLQRLVITKDGVQELDLVEMRKD